MVKIRDNKIVIVHWKDSATYREWYNYEDIESEILDDTNIKSIGYVIIDNKDWIVLAQNIDDTSCSGITKIPKDAIINIDWGLEE